MKIEGYRFKGEKISLISIKETDVDMWSTTPSPADLQACRVLPRCAALFGLLMPEHHPRATPLDNYGEPLEYVLSAGG